jgi:hypothetical protein
MGKHFEEYHINGKTYRLHLFDNIETREQAYLIGYLMGDGNFQNKERSKKKRKSRMSIGSIEKDLITSIRDHFCPDTPISSRIPVNKTRNIKSNTESHRFTFSSKYSDTFEKYGLLDFKENRRIVNIPKKFMRYFILGLFDADGHISYGRRKDRNRLWAHIGITHASFYVLTAVQNYLMNELNIASAVTERKDEKCFDLRFSSREKVADFIEYIYKDVPLFYNQTKKNNCLSYIKEFRDLIKNKLSKHKNIG